MDPSIANAQFEVTTTERDPASMWDVFDSWVDAVGENVANITRIPGQVIHAASGAAEDAADAAKWGVAAYAFAALTGTVGLYFLWRSGLLTQIAVGVGKLVAVVL